MILLDYSKRVELKGKTALVTGAARRIGRVIALCLAKEGAHVLWHYHTSGKEAEEEVLLARQRGCRAWSSSCDLSKSGQVAPWFHERVAEIGPIDLLINSASSFPEGNYSQLNSEKLTKAMELQVLSPLVLIRALASQGRPASVVNILDTRISDRDPSHAAYHLSKRSLFTLSKDLAVELAPTVRVNAVAPGLILPPAERKGGWGESLKASNPMRMFGTPEQVAEAVIYLCRADFVTGEVLYVDGGRHLKGNAYGL